MNRICNSCGNTRLDEKVEFSLNQQKKTISVSTCGYCLSFNEDQIKKQLKFTPNQFNIQFKPGTEEYFAKYEDVKKIHGWWSSAYDHYLCARHALLSGRTIQGVTSSAECLEKLLKGMFVLEFPTEDSFSINHEPYKIYQKMCSLKPKRNGQFNKNFLNYLENLYRLRYKPEDRTIYPNGFHVVMNPLQILMDLDHSIYNFMIAYEDVGKKAMNYHGTIWTENYKLGNVEISNKNIFFNKLILNTDLDYLKKIKEHLIYQENPNKKGWIITEFWVETQGQDKLIREITYRTGVRRCMDEKYIIQSKFDKRLSYGKDSIIEEYVNFIKVHHPKP